jgi:O-antigen/teichoic acid export membrane protein
MFSARYNAKTKANNNIAESNEIWKLITSKVFKVGLILLIISIFLIPWVGSFLKISSYLPIFLVFSALFVSLLASINNGVLIGWQKFLESGLSNISSVSVKLIFAVLLLYFGLGVNGVMIGFFLGGTAMYLVSFVAIKILFKNKKKLREIKKEKIEIDFIGMKKYIFPVLIGTLALNILGNIDMVMAKHHLDATLSGHYGALTVMSKVIFFATGAIATVLFSMSSEENHKKKDSKKSFINSIILTSIIAFSAIAFYFLFPRFVISIFFGERYFLIAQYLGWFAVMATLFSFINLIIQYLLSINKTKFIWIFLLFSIIEGSAIYFFGKNIYTIIEIVLFVQAFAIFIGLFLIFKKTEKKNTQQSL